MAQLNCATTAGHSTNTFLKHHPTTDSLILYPMTDSNSKQRDDIPLLEMCVPYFLPIAMDLLSIENQ
ncbi:MAG: hypothetical protein JNL70_24120 [Saprospiraceae bacterium]|nr:hypothetical protein [Saprospiraceae bacterium]